MKRHRRRRANRAHKNRNITENYPYLTVKDVCRMFRIPVHYMYSFIDKNEEKQKTYEPKI